MIWRTARKLRIRVAHDMISLCMCVKTSMQIVWTSHLNTWTSRKAPSLKKHFTFTLISRIPALDKGSFKWNTSIIHMYIYNIHTILPRKHVQEVFFMPTCWPYFRFFCTCWKREFFSKRMNPDAARVHVYKWLYRLIYVYTPLFYI